MKIIVISKKSSIRNRKEQKSNFKKKSEKNAFKAKLGEIKTLSQYSQEMRERKRDITKLEKMVSSKSELIEKLESQKKQINDEIGEFIEINKNTKSKISTYLILDERYKNHIEKLECEQKNSNDVSSQTFGVR